MYLRRRVFLPTLGVRPVRAVGSRLWGARAAAPLFVCGAAVGRGWRWLAEVVMVAFAVGAGGGAVSGAVAVSGAAAASAHARVGVGHGGGRRSAACRLSWVQKSARTWSGWSACLPCRSSCLSPTFALHKKGVTSKPLSYHKERGSVQEWVAAAALAWACQQCRKQSLVNRIGLTVVEVWRLTAEGHNKDTRRTQE